MNAVIPRTGPSQRAELICLMMHAYKCYLRTLLNRLFGVRIRLWNASLASFVCMSISVMIRAYTTIQQSVLIAQVQENFSLRQNTSSDVQVLR